MAIGGGSAGAHTSGLFNLRAIYSLNLLVGSVNTPGGVIFNPAPPLEELASQDVMAMGAPASYRGWKEMDRPQVLMIRGVNPIHGLPAGRQLPRGRGGSRVCGGLLRLHGRDHGHGRHNPA